MDEEAFGLNKSNRLLKGMVYVFAANVFNMIFNIVTNFILPKYLSVDSYAAIKTYQLYISYVGLFHFGFVDGIYLKYGGKQFDEIDVDNLSRGIATHRISQIIISFMLVLVAMLLKNTVFLFFAIAVIPLNMISYFTMLYQATGEFGRYGRIINTITALSCVANVVFIFIVKSDDYRFFLASYVTINVGIWILLEILFKINTCLKIKFLFFSVKELFENCKSGILLMLGNLSSFILTGLDRWFVKGLLDNSSFAYYSFAVSIESFLNVAMNSVTVTLYNYFCNQRDEDRIIRIRNCVIVFAACIIAAAFPAKFILEMYLPNYKPASKVMFILFATQIFSLVNKGIYINLYKAQRRQKEYFIKLIIVIVAATILNYIFFMIYPQMESFAVATFFAAVLWFILNKIGFPSLVYGIRVYLFILFVIIDFLLCGFFLSALYGLLLYGGILILLILLLMKDDAAFLKEKLINIIHDKIRK